MDTIRAAYSVSFTLLGFALANLPLGRLADRINTRRLFIVGAVMVAAAGGACSISSAYPLHLAARLVQGMFIPALTTCAAAYLAKTLAPGRLNLVMGRYVAATVLGGMLGRLMGGLMPGTQGWRSAFAVAALATLTVAVLVARSLVVPPHTHGAGHREATYRGLLLRAQVWLYCLCGGIGQAIFSPVFNVLPYRLAEAGLELSQRQSTLLYLTYLVGIYAGPAAGRRSTRLGNGRVMIAASVFLGLSLVPMFAASLPLTIVGLAGTCAGFFALHAAAVGALNRRLRAGQGRANALYVLSYYAGAALGVSWSAAVYETHGWNWLLTIALLLTLLPLTLGIYERRARG